MSRAAQSILAFGIYLGFAGVVLFAVPERACRLFALPCGDGFWVRMVAMLFCILAYYCVRAAREEQAAFMRWSLRTRPLTLLVLGCMVALGQVRPTALFFGLIDLIATGITSWALLRDSRPGPAGGLETGSQPPCSTLTPAQRTP